MSAPFSAIAIVAALVLTIAQIIFGTQVRESVDTIVEAGLPKEVWLQRIKREL